MMSASYSTTNKHEPLNKGKLCGQKRPLKLQQVWAIRVRLQMEGTLRALALFELAIDSMLRACDLLALKVSDVVQGGRFQSRVRIVQRKLSYLSSLRSRSKHVRLWNTGSKAVQLLPGHTRLESTVRYVGIDFDDALELSEQTEV